jgi:hypothetical protein
MSVSYLKIVILLPQILRVVMTSPCSISALVKITTLFCHSYSVLHSFWCLWMELWFEPELILARQVPYHLSKPPALHMDIKWLFSWALSVASLYDSMAFLEMFPWRHRTHSSFVAWYSSLYINKTYLVKTHLVRYKVISLKITDT